MLLKEVRRAELVGVSNDEVYDLAISEEEDEEGVAVVYPYGMEVTNPLSEKPKEIYSNICYYQRFSAFRFYDLEHDFFAAARHIRDRLIKQWNETFLHFHKLDPKQTYYMSMEYVQGRALLNALGNLNILPFYVFPLQKFRRSITKFDQLDKYGELGNENGGLGRLASCFLDSMATLNLPAWGYGLRYRSGVFKQRLTEQGLEEIAEDWLDKFSPWEVVRHDIVFPVRFFGAVEVNSDGSRKWVGGEVMQALAYDVPIPGYKTKNTISLRLWEARARAEDFNLSQFNNGQHESAAQLHARARLICAVLYPGDATEKGKLLRLEQQYFLCSASLQDIIVRFKERRSGKESRVWSEFPCKVAVQLNGTHPSLAIPELMRLLMDDEGLAWDEAWDVTTRTFAYTNHNILLEALDKWPQSLMSNLLPRHMEIIRGIDDWFLAMIKVTRPDLHHKLVTMRILDDHDPHNPIVRMANLCVVSSHTVNGVSRMQSEILKAELFANYVCIWPTKFQNKTNGITPRRWLRFLNPSLSFVITKWLKTDKWISNLELLSGLRNFADNADLQQEWQFARMSCKKRLARYIFRETGVYSDAYCLFDVQVKQIHECKRQLLNILGVIHRYKILKEMSAHQRKHATPRFVMMGGKLCPTDTHAKQIVKLVNDVGAVVNNDHEVNGHLKVVFIPNYNVSLARKVIPGSELSQHITTAGMEVSGTSNIKFALNGCLIIGTYDGANVEIREEVGEENFFLFGARADQVPRLREERENGMFKPDPRFEEAKQLIRSGAFGNYDYTPLLDSLEGNSGDVFLLGHDFSTYLDAQARVDDAYMDRKRWVKMSILSTAGCGNFSSDQTVAQYAKEIWNIHECRLP